MPKESLVVVLLATSEFNLDAYRSVTDDLRDEPSHKAQLHECGGPALRHSFFSFSSHHLEDWGSAIDQVSICREGENGWKQNGYRVATKLLSP